MTAARDLTRKLGGRWHGTYGMVCCPAHADHAPSLKLIDGETGLTVHCFAGCDWRDVKTKLRNDGVIEDSYRHNHPDTQRPRATTKPRRKPATDRTENALALWHRARPAAGTPVATYLRERGITMAIPPTIRYLQDAKHGPTGLLLPALIAAVQGVDRRVTGVLRIFLAADGTRKAGVSNPKLMLGRVKGGAVRLGPVASRIAIAEGLETALSIAQSCPEIPVWAALSTSGMTSIELPPEVREVILACDGDIPGNEAGRAAAQRFIDEGRRARICAAPAGLDFNDVLLAG